MYTIFASSIDNAEIFAVSVLIPMSRGYGRYEREILVALISPWQKRQEKCRCYRCIENKVRARISARGPWLPFDSRDRGNKRRSFRRAFRRLEKKGVIVVCDHCGTVRMWDDPHAGKKAS